MAGNLYKQQESNITKTWILMTGFLVLIIAIGWFLGFYFDNPAILPFAIVFSILMNIFSYWHSDKVVLRITGAKPANRKEHFDLYTSVENLAITAGLPMPKVYIINDPVPNAFATGRNKDHAVVAVTSGLLEMLNKNELEGVVAHELAHIGNRDILLQTVIVVLVGIIALLSDMFLRMSFYGGDNKKMEGRAGVIILLVGVVLMILSPIIATIIKLAVSRKREFLADATGALLTRYPEGLASALEKISSYSGPKMKKASHATAHLFIADPYVDVTNNTSNVSNASANASSVNGKKKKVSFLTKMFATHPPTEERVAALRGLDVVQMSSES